MGALHLIWNSRQLTIYFSIYTFIAYIAISCHMNVVKRYGGVAAVLVATGRKAMTLILSFLLFPKGFSWFYPVGAVLVLGGLLVSSLSKIRSKGHSKQTARPSNGHHHHASSKDSRNNDDAEILLPLSHKPVKSHISDIESPPHSNNDHTNDGEPWQRSN